MDSPKNKPTSKTNAERDLVYPIVIAAIKTFWKYLRIRFKFSGIENIPTKGGAVIASNHIGYLDFAFIGTGALPQKRLIRFMAKKSIFDHKIAGPLMRGMHHIAVDRDNGSTSFVAALRTLKKGELVGIFPEATISQSFEVKEMKTGAVRLAMASGTPVIPVAIWGSQRVMTKGHKPNFKPVATPIHLIFGKPIYFTKDQDVTKCDELLRQEIIKLLWEVQSQYPDSHQGQWWAPVRLGGSAPAPTFEL